MPRPAEPRLRDSVALGLLQGPAELLPISSTAHVELLGRRLAGYTRLSAAERKELAVALSDQLPEGASIVGLDFDASVAWPVYDWMGVSKAALEAVSRYLARDMGPRGVRVNLISAGPIATAAASGIPGFDGLASAWPLQAPLGWDSEDPDPVADAACFLLSDLSRAVTGEILHVDGGFHAVGAAPAAVSG